MLLHYMICRMRHSTMVETLHLIESNIRMTNQLEHAPEVSLFLVTAVECFYSSALFVKRLQI